MLPRIAFFGTPEYSLIVSDLLLAAGYQFACVITKPARPVGRKQILMSTPVALWAQDKQLPIISPKSQTDKPWLFSDENEVTDRILEVKPDLLITADYTQKIPTKLINHIKYGGLNVHPSLLPAYRGPAPVPWALLKGEQETGVSIVTLADRFDEGKIIGQIKEPIFDSDTTVTILKRLFKLGGDLLVKVLPEFIQKTNMSPVTSGLSPSYFPRLTRDHGFEPWKKIEAAIEMAVEAKRIERKWRAFHPWPGLWTLVKVKNQDFGSAKKRLKILKTHISPVTSGMSLKLVLDEIQIEGKNPIRAKEMNLLLENCH